MASPKNFIREKRLEYHKLFSQWLDEINDMIRHRVEPYLINNKLVDIRNNTGQFLDKCLSELVALQKHGVTISLPLRTQKQFVAKSYGVPCIVCGERRAINYSHIIPRSEGGSNDAGNMLRLCPTHHFLFDHARLSKAEFERLEHNNLNPESIQYLRDVHASRHEMRWKYQTNRFPGCKCGSKDFRFICRREQSSVDIALQCNQCKEVWLNVWEDLHPISQLKTIIFDPSLPKEKVQQLLDKAEDRIQKFLATELDSLLSGSVW